jgi:phage-related protein
MAGTAQPKPLVWIGSSRKDLKSFPAEVQDVFGYAPYVAQMGGKHPDAKPLKGFGGGGSWRWSRTITATLTEPYTP